LLRYWWPGMRKSVEEYIHMHVLQQCVDMRGHASPLLIFCFYYDTILSQVNYRA